MEWILLTILIGVFIMFCIMVNKLNYIEQHVDYFGRSLDYQEKILERIKFKLGKDKGLKIDNKNKIDVSEYDYAILVKGFKSVIYQKGTQLKRVKSFSCKQNLNEEVFEIDIRYT